MGEVMVDTPCDVISDSCVVEVWVRVGVFVRDASDAPQGAPPACVRGWGPDPDISREDIELVTCGVAQMTSLVLCVLRLCALCGRSTCRRGVVSLVPPGDTCMSFMLPTSEFTL